MEKIIILFTLFVPMFGFAQQYSVDWHKVSGGGGVSSGGNYSLTGGFWSLISIVQTTGAPTLTITHSGNSVTILWQYPSIGWTLQQSPDLSAGSWSTSRGASNDGTNNFITVTTPRNLFFRLSKHE